MNYRPGYSFIKWHTTLFFPTTPNLLYNILYITATLSLSCMCDYPAHTLYNIFLNLGQTYIITDEHGWKHCEGYILVTSQNTMITKEIKCQTGTWLIQLELKKNKNTKHNAMKFHLGGNFKYRWWRVSSLKVCPLSTSWSQVSCFLIIGCTWVQEFTMVWEAVWTSLSDTKLCVTWLVLDVVW